MVGFVSLDCRLSSWLIKRRHPGLAPGPWLVPGSIQKGRDVKTTPLSSSRTRSGTLACPGTYSKRPRYKNNHRWMFPRSRISVIPGSTRDLRDDGWEYRWGDFGTTDGDKRFAFPGRRLSGYILAPSSRTCSGTLTCSGSLARPGVFGTTDGRGLNRNHLITACGFGVV